VIIKTPPSGQVNTRSIVDTRLSDRGSEAGLFSKLAALIQQCDKISPLTNH